MVYISVQIALSELFLFMKLKSLYTLQLLLLSAYIQAQEIGSIEIAKRYAIRSETLNEERFYDIYLPASYNSRINATYPVLYIMDGDYNFWYIAGMIEQMASVGNKIPEMIVVGIADNGHENYINNCTPYNKQKSPNGQSEKFLKFIATELRPQIERMYRTADFDILAGHSLGGYFVINALLSEPKSFNAYIAISPSLWKNDYEAETQVEEFFKKNENLNRYLYMSLGNEKGMGVYGFHNQMDINTFADEYYKNAPLGLHYAFKQYPNENHNSVGLITINDGLKFIFEGYDVGEDELSSMQTFKAYEERIAKFVVMLGPNFRLPENQLTAMVKKFCDSNEIAILQEAIKERYPASLGDYYNALANIYMRNKKYDDAIKTAEQNYNLNPKTPEYITTLADVYLAGKESDKAKAMYRKALDMAYEIGARQWYINQLKANVSNVK